MRITHKEITNVITQFEGKTAVLTGAGISTASGIGDFRGPQGRWTLDPDAERVSTLSWYLSDPDVRAKAWAFRAESPVYDAQPNPAHTALVALENGARLTGLITQNTDGLHQLAGSNPELVIELHGNSRTWRCETCRATGPMVEMVRRVRAGEIDPRCPFDSGIVRATTILFEEGLDPATIDAAVAKQTQIVEKKARDALLVRVHADKLDQLIDLIGELVIAGASANLLAQKSRYGRPGLAGLRIDGAVAIALQIRNPAPAAGVGDRHRHELAAGHLHGAKCGPCLQGRHFGHPALLLGCRKAAQQHGAVINDFGGQGVGRKQRKRHCNAIIGLAGDWPSQPPASAWYSATAARRPRARLSAAASWAA